MPISRDTLLAIEQAAVRSWPALETAGIDGWLWRHASGGSLRANSVAALAFTGASVGAAIAEAERRYRARGAPCRFTDRRRERARRSRCGGSPSSAMPAARTT